MRGSAPGERRGGRAKGTPNKRTRSASELLAEAQLAFPEYNALTALIALAKDAEAKGDVETARQCHATVLPYTAPRFRPVECDPEAALEYEERLAEIRSRHTAAALKQASPLFGLAERIERARAALDEEERAARTITPARPVPISPPAPAAEPAQAIEPPAGPALTPVAQPEPMPAAQARTIATAPAYQPLWPEPVGTAATEYDVFSAYGLD